MAKAAPKQEWEQLPLIEGDFGMKRGASEEWHDMQWEKDRAKALLCVEWLRNRSEQYAGRCADVDEQRIADGVGQFHEYVHRRLMSVWRRKIDENLVHAGHGYWNYALKVER